MKTRIEYAVAFSAIAAVSLGQGQCPATTPPPFDATGTYVGTWTGATDDMSQEAEACPLTFTLTQNVNAQGLSAYAINGTVLIDNSCIDFPPIFEIDEPQETPINMIMGTNGGIGTGALNCQVAVCFAFVIGGQGRDEDADGFMDGFGGDWSFSVLLAGVEPFTVTGTFEVDRLSN